jgi:hypothetical protein
MFHPVGKTARKGNWMPRQGSAYRICAILMVAAIVDVSVGFTQGGINPVPSPSRADPFAPVLPSCKQVAHYFGRLFHDKPKLRKSDYNQVLRDWGNPIYEELETGHSYCWPCTRDGRDSPRDDPFADHYKVCLFVDFDWSIQKWTWPGPEPDSPKPVEPRHREDLRPSQIAPEKVFSQDEIKRITQSAMDGDPEAQYRLGTMLRDGIGIPRDYRKAAEWFFRAAEKGHKGAQKALEEGGVK